MSPVPPQSVDLWDHIDSAELAGPPVPCMRENALLSTPEQNRVRVKTPVEGVFDTMEHSGSSSNEPQVRPVVKPRHPLPHLPSRSSRRPPSPFSSSILQSCHCDGTVQHSAQASQQR